MDVICALFLIGGACAGSVALAYWSAYRGAMRAYDAACQRADMAEGRERLNFEMLRTLGQQNMAMAQQLATLRVRHGAEPEERSFEPTPDHEPWSDELTEFVSAIENQEARDIIEEEVEAMRLAGKSDVEILARISMGD